MTPRRRAAIGLAVLFLVNSAMGVSLGPRLAEIASSLAMSNAALGAALFVDALARILATFTLGSRLNHRFGAGATACWCALLYCGLTAAAAAAWSWTSFAVLLFLRGAAGGLLLVAIARLSTAAELASNRTLFTYFDVPAAVGSLLAAGAGALTAGRLSPGISSVALGAAFALPLLATWRAITRSEHGQPMAKHPAPAPPLAQAAVTALWILIAMAGLLELAVWDWASLLYRAIGAPATADGVGTVAFGASLVPTLLLSGPLADRWGRPRVLRAAALCAFGGTAVTVFGHSVLWVTIGVAIIGAGIGPVTPLLLSVAGIISHTMQIQVLIAGTAGPLVGRPLIGLLADALGIQVALGVVGVLVPVTIIALARYAAPGFTPKLATPQP